MRCSVYLEFWYGLRLRAQRRRKRRTTISSGSGCGAKIEGLISAPRATITPRRGAFSQSPATCRSCAMCARWKTEPFATIGTSTAAMIARSCVQSAGILLSVSTCRRCTATECAPAATNLRTSESVASVSSSNRTLHETAMRAGSSRRSAEMISAARSESLSSAAPIPPCSENFLGQPMFKSTPSTSAITTLAAATAVSGEAEPSWKTRCPRSLAGSVRKMTVGWGPGNTKSTVPSAVFSTRSSFITFRSTSSSL
mmetsp:Transcript_11954/g.30121  ORF Transcript_11954/g.30121 Transcript_11954/m.30121 type:complete len:255 (-) Transcript_11954:286-1050(-)